MLISRHRLRAALAAVPLLLAPLPARAAELPRPKAEGTVIRVDPAPRFELSPHLYMQFMEPLGTTDSSVEAAWSQQRDAWRKDVVEATQELAPPMLRWGGCFSSYYRWKEAVGPRDRRVPMQNLLWGGLESNQVGTAEFVDFCRQVGAEALMCVNFESDGRKGWAQPAKGGVRSAGPEEAAEWVDYCNNPDNALRKSHGLPQPLGIRLWQIGNETSYDKNGFDVEAAARKTVEFAKAMRRADPSIRLIGWGDSGWARRMLEVAGSEIQYIAFHHMFAPPGPLKGIEYRKDPAKTWDALMDAWQPHEKRIQSMRRDAAGSDVPLALTECHFALPGRNRGDVLSTWAAGVAYARMLNLHERHGDRLKIATLADFCGNRWQVNAVMIPTPGGKAFLMPVARVMSLYRKHGGAQALEVAAAPEGLDVTASRTGNRLFLHVVNTSRTQPAEASLAGLTVRTAAAFEIAADPEFEVIAAGETLAPKQKDLPKEGRWTFPAASVTAVEAEVNAP